MWNFLFLASLKKFGKSGSPAPSSNSRLELRTNTPFGWDIFFPSFHSFHPVCFPHLCYLPDSVGMWLCNPWFFFTFYYGKKSNIYRGRIIRWAPMHTPSSFNNCHSRPILIHQCPHPFSNTATLSLDLFWNKSRHRIILSANISICVSKNPF